MHTTHAMLRRLAGAVWIGVGTMLVWRGLAMLFVRARAAPEEATTLAVWVSLAAGLLIGALKGHYVLARTARRNRRRIERLARPRIQQAFTPRFAVLVPLMIALGVLLRMGAGHGWLGGFTVVGGIYVGIGSGLFVSAFVYFLAPPPPLPTRSDHPPPAREPRTGVLVVNLGTPDEPTPRAVRRYLREFLSDPRVVEVNRAVWAFVLNVIILPFRSRASAAAYAKVWTKDGSPLLTHSRRIAGRLGERLGERFVVVLGMRYGNPSLAAALDQLAREGCDAIVVLPLFPQYSNSTTGTVQAEVGRLVAQQRAQPTLRFTPPYFDHPLYISALAARVREVRGGAAVELHVFSFHGLPEAYVRRGDPYVDHCTRTAFALAEELGLDRAEWELVFQSRFGDEPWLQPYLDETVPALPPRATRILVSVPGFATDCLETLEEVDIRLRADFMAAGGRVLLRASALNDHPLWIEALESVVRGSAGPATACATGAPGGPGHVENPAPDAHSAELR